MIKKRLFCIPYEGSEGEIFRRWARYLHESIDLYPVELSGRGSRYTEPLYRSIEDAVNDVFDLIRKSLDEYEYSFFGYSMGSIIAFELCHKVKVYDYRTPSHLFIAGHGAPHRKRKMMLYTQLDDLFLDEPFTMGGIPSGLQDLNSEIWKVYLPILKNDFKITEEYQYITKRKLDCDITILCGRYDKFTIGDLVEWNIYTNKRCEVFLFDGGHFFLNQQITNIANTIDYKLKEL